MDLLLLSLSDPAKNNAPAPPLPPSDYTLQLEMEWNIHSSRQFVAIGAASVFVHFLFFILALQLPNFVQRRLPERVVVEHRTPLYFPRELTQKAPNKNKPTKDIDLASLIASQQDQQRQQASPKPSVRHFEPPQNAGAPQQNTKTPKIMAEAPNLALNQKPADLGAGAINGLSAPPPPPNASPSPFQTAGGQAPPKITTPQAQPPPGSLRPGSSIESPTVPAPALPGLNGQIGNLHPAIELLSDPQGADFKPYLERILAIVRANWQRVTPEAVRQGHLRGRAVIQFVINRDGHVAGVIVAEPSGVTQLDVAAGTSLVMSSPLPQLPPEFKGGQVKLAFTFSYNMPVR